MTVLFAQPTAAKAKRVLTEKDMGAYLFTYFTDATHSLFMAISYDGYTFRPVNNGEPIIAGDSIAEQHGIRDPHIYQWQVLHCHDRPARLRAREGYPYHAVGAP
jgi:hypothetical protein